MIDEAEVQNDLDQIRSRYDVLRRLGRDGECEVYGVRIRGSDRHFALKMMANPGRQRGQGALQVWQAHTVEQLEHPKVMVLHAVHHLQGGAVALAMERRRGRTLAQAIESDGPMPVPEVERVLRDAAEALAYLHERGAVHRGVRPQSIFLDRDAGHARLAHFGLDPLADTGGDDDSGEVAGAGSALLGTFAYLAPEQIKGREQVEGRRLGPRSDLYSLGLVGYAMLTGADPWTGTDLDTLTQNRKRVPVPSLATARADAPAHLRRAIEGCLDRNPRGRWRSVEEFLAALEPSPDEEETVRSTHPERLRARAGATLAAIRTAVVNRSAARTNGRAAIAVAGTGAMIALVGVGVLRTNVDPRTWAGADRPHRSAAALDRLVAGAPAAADMVPTDSVAPRRFSLPPPLMTVEEAPSRLSETGTRSAPADGRPLAPRGDPVETPAAPPRARSAAGTAPVLLGEPITAAAPMDLLGIPAGSTSDVP